MKTIKNEHFLILHHLSEPFWAINVDLELIYTNQAYQNLQNQLEPLKENLPSKEQHDKTSILALYQSALGGKEILQNYQLIGSINGNNLFGRLYINPIRNEQGVVVALICQWSNIQSVQDTEPIKQLINSALDVFCCIDKNGNFTFVSDASTSLWGYQPHELTHTPFRSYIVAEDLSKTDVVAAAIMNGQETKSFINRYHKKGGGLAFNLWSARWDEQTQTMYCVARDAREKIEQDEIIKKSEERFKALAQEGTDVLAILSREGSTLYISSNTTKILGIDPNQFSIEKLVGIVPPAERENLNQFLKTSAAKERLLLKPQRIKKDNAQGQWLETSLTNMIDNAAVGGIVARVTDVTEKMEEQQRLRLLESVVTNTSDAVLITEAEPFDEPGPKIVYVNEAFTKLTGYTAEEVVGKTPRILQGPNSDFEALKKLGQALRRWERCEVTTINYKKNGDEFWINFSVAPVADESGWYTHWIAIERDVTEQKEKTLQKELLAKISLDFSFENDLQQSLHLLCKTVSQFGKFDFSEVWIPNVEYTQLQLFARYVATEQAHKFYKLGGKIKTFAFAQGLPGAVWQKKTSMLWKDLGKQNNFPRQLAAQKAGICALLGIPLLFKSEVVGVLVLATNQHENHLQKHVRLFKQLKPFIGSEISRKRLENDLHRMYQAMPDILCLVDYERRFLKLNPAGCQLLEYEEHEMLHKQMDEFVHPEDLGHFKTQFIVLLNRSESCQFECRFITKNGQVIWLSWICNTTHDERLIYSTARNITENKRLRELNRQAGSLAKIGSWEIDVQKELIYWSDIVHQIHETNAQTFNPTLTTSIDFYRIDFQEKVRAAFENIFKHGHPLDYEAVIVTTIKQERWVRVIAHAEMINGKTTRIYGSFQDINDVKSDGLRLKELSDNLPGVVFQYILRPDGTDELKHVSKGSEKMWGLTPEEAENDINLVWSQTKAGGAYAEVQDSIRHSLSTKTPWFIRYRTIMPNGEDKVVQGMGTPQFLSDGSVVYNSIVLDVTKASQNEELLNHATELAKIGSWEIKITNATQNTEIYWSPMLRQILEVDSQYDPNITKGLEFYSEQGAERLYKAIEGILLTGDDFDIELEVKTAKGNFKWVRCIGKTEYLNEHFTRVYGSYQDIHLAKSLEIQVREILESISDAFYALDEDWTFSYFNKEAETLLSKKAEEVIGKNIWLEFAPAIDTPLYQNYHDVMTKKVPLRFEYWYPGDNCWYEVNAYPSRRGISVFFKNINDRIKAAEALQKAYEEKNQILESIGDAFFTVDHQGIVTYWNKVAETLLGLKREDIIGRELWQHYDKSIHAISFQQYQYAMQTGEIVSFEDFNPISNQWFDVTAYPSDNGLSVYFKDITLRKEADTRLLQANKRFEKASEATSDAIWDLNLLNNELYWGQGFFNLFGYETSNGVVNYSKWEEHVHPDDLPKLLLNVENLMNSEVNYWTMEYRFKKQSGEYAIVLDRGTVIRNNFGKPIRLIGAMADVTEQRNQELKLKSLNNSLQKYAKELERSNQELEQFAFITSHDLQEPLRMISSFMDQLKRKYGEHLDEKANQYIFFAIDGAQRMKKIILDLLEYSRAGKQMSEPEKIDLHEVIDEYLVLRRKIISETKAQFSYSELPDIYSYRAAVVQVFHALLDNAIKYSKKEMPPEIKITCQEHRDHWLFAIQDNGIGIEKEFYDQVFIIFQRLHNRNEYEGTGIGLSIAKKNVELLNGQIWIESTPGVGTTVFFTVKNLILN